jgi:hypothetical protein
MLTCIYCQRVDPLCGFNREHVVPEALGTFEGDVITLTQEVCRDCNQYFGDNLEIVLNRDSAEAMFRFRHRLKEPAEVRGMFRRRVEMRLPKDGTKWGGAHLELLAPPAGQLEPYVGLAPQLACERRDGGWEFFTEDELRKDVESVKAVIARDCTPVRVLWTETEEVKARLLALLAEKGIPFKGQRDITESVPAFSDGRVNAEVEFTFDKILARAIAKIAFNHLAKIYGAAFVLRAEFSAVRRFIRDGEGHPPDFVQFQPAPVLRDSRGREVPPKGHLLVARWSDVGKDIRVMVSPFQHVSYVVRLARDFDEPQRQIDSVYLYDLGTRQASKAVPVQIPGDAAAS